MLKRLLTAALFLGLGFGVVAALPTRAAEPAADAAKIAKLVEQLGSNTFDMREAATKELDTIGVPALEALRKAATSEDAEVSRRAKGLVAKIEKFGEAKTALKPTKLHLVFKDTPVVEAVAEINKQSGYNVVIHDPENKLKDRKVTLDTGDTTFWQGFEQFCEKAGVHEANQQDLIQPLPPIKPGLPPQPVPPGGIQIQPIQPGNIQIQILPAPLPPEKAPAEKVPAEKARAVKPGAALAADEAPAATKPAAPPVAAQPAVQPVPPVNGPGGGPIGGIRPPIGRILPQQPGQITVVDGKPEAQATDYSSAVRVRAQTKNTIYGNAPEGQILFALEITPEAKITWQSLVGVKLDKVIDDNDQKLGEAMVPVPPNGRPVPFGGAPGGAQPAIMIARPIFFGSGHQYAPIRLQKGDKASKSLKEISGTISAEILPEAKTLIKTDEILKSAGKTFKGEDGGVIKIVSVDKDETTNQVKVVFEFEAPAGYVANNVFQGGFGGGVGGNPGIVPPGLPVPQANPAPAVLPKKGAPAGAGLQVGQAQAGQAQAAPVQIQVGGGIAVAPIRPLPANVGMNGLRLVDDKGKPVDGQAIFQNFKQPAQAGQPFTVEWNLTFPVKKDQTEAGKLTFAASKPVTVDIPFTLKDVMLP